MSLLMEMLSYPFLVRAFVGGILISLCASLLGVSLVLKRYSMIGDGLSHVGFGALAVAAALNAAPLAAAIPVVIVAAVLLLRIRGNSRIKGDAAIALISTWLVYTSDAADEGSGGGAGGGRMMTHKTVSRCRR